MMFAKSAIVDAFWFIMLLLTLELLGYNTIASWGMYLSLPCVCLCVIFIIQYISVGIWSLLQSLGDLIICHLQIEALGKGTGEEGEV